MNVDFATILQWLKSLLSLFLTIITTFFGFFLGGKKTYAPLEPDKLIMSGVIISDTHISQNESDRTQTLLTGLKDMNNSEAAFSFLCVTGDLTDTGSASDHDKFFSTLRSNSKAADHVIALGNHDYWKEAESFGAFKKGYAELAGRNLSKPYYSVSINGYYFIVIGTEKGLQNEAYLSNEQLDWVDAQLESITSVSSKPVFMICHQPLNGTNRVDEAWAPGKLGAQSDRLKSIIRKYTDHGSTVILASGHLHSGFGYTKPTHENGLYYLDLPSYGKTPSRGNVRETGCGLVVEIYNDKIVCRARNFASGKFYESYNYNIPVETQEKALIPAA